MARIALYAPSLSGGGAERVMLHLAEGFAGAGHSVVLLLDRAAAAYTYTPPAGITVDVLGASRTFLAAGELRAALRRHQPDVLVSCMLYNNLNAALLRAFGLCKCRVVLTEHNIVSIQLKRRSKLQRFMLPRLMRLTYPAADMLVAVSDGVREDLDAMGVKPRQSHVIGNPILPENWQELYAAPLPLPHVPFLPRPLVLAAGRLMPQKDFSTLLRAFKLFHEKHGGSLLLVGEGVERSALTAEIAALGLKQHVHMPGFVDPVYPLYAAADVFALSSAWEGFGNVLVEAMAAGIPVVSTDCPSGPSFILDNGRYGALVPVGDAAAFAAALSSALSATAQQREALRTRALDFKVSTVAAKYLEVLLVNS